jgi:hypothetical protein
MHQSVSQGWGGVRKLTQRYHVTQVMSGETSNLVVKVDMKENVGEGPMMANNELLEAWVTRVRQIQSPVMEIRLPGCPRRV